MQVAHMTFAIDHAEFIKPFAVVLFELLAHDFAVNLGPRLAQDLLKRGCIAPVDGGPRTLLVDITLEITGEMITSLRAPGWRHSAEHANQERQPMSHHGTFVLGA
jgi:hypothetical protein